MKAYRSHPAKNARKPSFSQSLNAMRDLVVAKQEKKEKEKKTDGIQDSKPR